MIVRLLLKSYKFNGILIIKYTKNIDELSSINNSRREKVNLKSASPIVFLYSDSKLMTSG